MTKSQTEIFLKILSWAKMLIIVDIIARFIFKAIKKQLNPHVETLHNQLPLTSELMDRYMNNEKYDNLNNQQNNE